MIQRGASLPRSPVVILAAPGFSATIVGIGIASILALAAPSRAQEPSTEVSASTDEIAPVERLGYGGLPARLNTLPSEAFYSDPALGISQRQLFRDTRNPFQPSFRTTDPGVDLRTETTDIRFRVGLPDFASRLGGLYGFEPERADLKVGPLYFKLNALSAGILASDNPDLSPTNPEPDAIAIVRLSGSIMAQVSESLRLTLGGTLYWLPFEGEVGFGLGALDQLFTLGYGEIALAQISWETRIGEWDIFVSDTLRIQPDYGGSRLYEDLVYFEGQGFDAADRAGRYSFGGDGYRRRQRVDNDSDSLSVDQYVIRNQIVGVAERLLPGPVRLRIRAFHEDLWYNQGSRGSPTLREGASILLRAERENLRFNPFIRYEIDRTDADAAFSQRIVFGLDGPITDQLRLSIYAGWYRHGESGGTRELAGLHLSHLAGPYTTESLFIGREIDDENEESIDSVRYQITQVLGPRLRASAYSFYNIITPLSEFSTEREEFGAGMRLTWELGPRMSASLLGAYRHESYGDGSDLFGDDDSTDSLSISDKILRLQVSYSFTPTFFGYLTYQHLNRDSSRELSSYRENLVYLTLTKYFE
jgi:hypothetical protein